MAAAVSFLRFAVAASGFRESGVGWKKHVEPRAFSQLRQNLIGYRLGGIFRDLLAADPTVGDSDARVEQPQVIENFGLSGDGGTRISRVVFLPYGNRRRNAPHFVDVRLVHPFQELAGVSRQRLDIASLAFCVDRVKSKRRLARPAHSGNHRQLVDGNRERDVLQVIDAGPADSDCFFRHRYKTSQACTDRNMADSENLKSYREISAARNALTSQELTIYFFALLCVISCFVDRFWGA